MPNRRLELHGASISEEASWFKKVGKFSHQLGGFLRILKGRKHGAKNKWSWCSNGSERKSE
jgi:hypothetical protein